MLPAGREPTADVLESIEQTGRHTMTGLRRLRGLLRKSGGEPSLAPQPGLSRFGDLVAEVREAGAEAWVRTDGNLAAISKGSITGDRLVRECLTNGLKHARAHRVGVLPRCRGRCTESTSLATGPRPRRLLRAASACSDARTSHRLRRDSAGRAPRRLASPGPRISSPALAVARTDHRTRPDHAHGDPPARSTRRTPPPVPTCRWPSRVIIGTRRMLRQDQPRDRNRSRAARASHE